MAIKERPVPLLFLLLLPVLAFLTGCARTPAIDYYQLVSPGKATSGKITPADVTLGLGPVKVPEYLDQPKIVSRLSANRLFLADSHRWAEPLAKNIASVLQQELAVLLHPKQIVTFPWPRSQPVDCQLLVEVLHFETAQDGTARLQVNWMVRNGDGKLLQPEKQASYQSKEAASGYGDRVRALNEVLNRFGHDLAEELLPLFRKVEAH